MPAASLGVPVISSPTGPMTLCVLWHATTVHQPLHKLSPFDIISLGVTERLSGMGELGVGLGGEKLRLLLYADDVRCRCVHALLRCAGCCGLHCLQCAYSPARLHSYSLQSLCRPLQLNSAVELCS